MALFSELVPKVIDIVSAYSDSGVKKCGWITRVKKGAAGHRRYKARGGEV